MIPNGCQCHPDQNDTFGLCFHKDLPGSNSPRMTNTCGIGSCQLDGTIRITHGLNFTNSLLDSDSTDFIDLKNKLEREVGLIDLK